MITSHSSRAASGAKLAAFFFFVGGCSPDLSLLDADTSFAGVGSGGEPEGATSGAGGGSAGSKANPGAAGDAPNGGDGNLPPPDGGAAGAANPAPCVATGTERCNAQDDDCNGIVDDGCPGGVTTTFAGDLQLLGDSTGGAPFTDDCKDGEVLSGLQVTTGTVLSQIIGICQPLSLELSSNAEHGYRVVLGEARLLGAHPETSQDSPTTLACPENEALVGVRLAEQHVTLVNDQVVPVITRVWVTCAKLVLVEHDSQLGVAWSGPKELAPASASLANGTAYLVSSNAPDGLVASRLLGASGSWVDRVGFGVSQLGIVLRRVEIGELRSRRR